MIRRGALLLAFVAAACGTKESATTLEVVAASSVETTFATAWASCPKTTAAQTSFGTLKVTNRLARPLVITEIASALGVTAVQPGAQIVDALSARELPLSCSPRGVETVRDQLTVTTDAGAMKLGVTVIGTGARIVTDPLALAFGDLPVVGGQPSEVTLPITIRNEGTAPLHFKKPLSVTLQNASGRFDQALDGNFVLPPRGSVTVKLFVGALQPGPVTGVADIETDDPIKPTFELAVTGTGISVAPCVLTFSPAPAIIPNWRKGATVHLTAHNGGTSTCTLSGFRFEGSSHLPFELLSAPPIVRIAPGEAYAFTIRSGTLMCCQQYPGSHDALLFNGSGPDLQPGRVDIVIDDPYCLSILPNEMEFGDRYTTCGLQHRTVNVYNSCSEPVTLESVALSSPAGCTSPTSCAGFVVALPSPNIVIPAASSTPVSFDVGFSPLSEGPAAATITLRDSRLGLEHVHEVALSANGIPPRNVDVFSMEAQPRGNLLFVVGAGSLARTNPQAFAQRLYYILWLLEPCGDYQMTVVSMGADGGVMNSTDGGNALVLRSLDDPNFVAELRARILAAASDETDAVESTARALTQLPFAESDGGALQTSPWTFVITDGPDTSPGTVASYDQQIRTTWATSNVHVIAPFSDTSCGATTDDGRLASFVGLGDVNHRRTKAEFCSAWGIWGKVAFGACDTWGAKYLNAVPVDAGSIVATVNGVQIPQAAGDGGTNWTYNPTQNSVGFTRGVLPFGSTLTLSYDVNACFTYPP